MESFFFNANQWSPKNKVLKTLRIFFLMQINDFAFFFNANQLQSLMLPKKCYLKKCYADLLKNDLQKKKGC